MYLGTPVEPQADKTEKTYSSILAIGSDELENMRSSSDPDLSLSKSAKSCWNVRYSYSIRVNVGVPTTISALVKQQIRWKKSFIRSLFSTGGIYWKRPFLSALLSLYPNLNEVCSSLYCILQHSYVTIKGRYYFIDLLDIWDNVYWNDICSRF